MTGKTKVDNIKDIALRDFVQKRLNSDKEKKISKYFRIDSSFLTKYTLWMFIDGIKLNKQCSAVIRKYHTSNKNK